MSSTAQAHMSIRERARTANYASQALDAIIQIHSAADPPALLDRLVKATATLGASASLYTAAIPEGGHEHSCFSIFACHPAYAQAHNNLGPLLTHPWFRFARTHTTSGSDRQVRIEKAADAVAIELARQYGFRSCFIVPTPAGIDLDRLEMLCVGSDAVDDFDGAEARVVRTLARSLAAELHDWLARYLQQRLRASTQLDSADVDLLALERRGLGTKEISAMTGLSEGSVNSRFQRINTRLNCSNRKASALRAAAHGLLESV